MAKKNEKVKYGILKLKISELDSLERILEYMEDSEQTHYEEHVLDGGVPKDHIYHHVKRIRIALRKQFKNV